MATFDDLVADVKRLIAKNYVDPATRCSLALSSTANYVLLFQNGMHGVRFLYEAIKYGHVNLARYISSISDCVLLISARAVISAVSFKDSLYQTLESIDFVTELLHVLTKTDPFVDTRLDVPLSNVIRRLSPSEFENGLTKSQAWVLENKTRDHRGEDRMILTLINFNCVDFLRYLFALSGTNWFELIVDRRLISGDVTLKYSAWGAAMSSGSIDMCRFLFSFGNRSPDLKGDEDEALMKQLSAHYSSLFASFATATAAKNSSLIQWVADYVLANKKLGHGQFNQDAWDFWKYPDRTYGFEPFKVIIENSSILHIDDVTRENLILNFLNRSFFKRDDCPADMVEFLVPYLKRIGLKKIKARWGFLPLEFVMRYSELNEFSEHYDTVVSKIRGFIERLPSEMMEIVLPITTSGGHSMQVIIDLGDMETLYTVLRKGIKIDPDCVNRFLIRSLGSSYPIISRSLAILNALIARNYKLDSAAVMSSVLSATACLGATIVHSDDSLSIMQTWLEGKFGLELFKQDFAGFNADEVCKIVAFHLGRLGVRALSFTRSIEFIMDRSGIKWNSKMTENVNADKMFMKRCYNVVYLRTWISDMAEKFK